MEARSRRLPAPGGDEKGSTEQRSEAGEGGSDRGENEADGSEGSLSGSGAVKATAAALRATKGGTANSVERDGENGATWEVEVTKTDGTTVDVRLDESYGVVVIEGDGE